VTDPAVTDPDALAPGAVAPSVQPPSGEAEAGEAESATGPTGHPVVDAAVARLSQQAELPPAEQVSGYEAAHRALSQTLASIDEG
jgi:hypothetical protein